MATTIAMPGVVLLIRVLVIALMSATVLALRVLFVGMFRAAVIVFGAVCQRLVSHVRVLAQMEQFALACRLMTVFVA